MTTVVTILFSTLTVTVIALLVGIILAVKAVIQKSRRSVSQDHPQGQSG